MNKKKRAYYILRSIEKLFPDAESELGNWNTPFQFLICIALSAQTTDAQVNKVTGNLFSQYPDPISLGSASVDKVRELINSINYYRTKGENIVKTSNMIVERFGGEPPRTVEELIELPGVGVKTANVFLNCYYNENQGIGVDTHVMRISQRLGLSTHKTPEKIQKDLEDLYEKKDWHKVNNLFVLYGRYYCKARIDPDKSRCIFKDGFCSWCSK